MSSLSSLLLLIFLAHGQTMVAKDQKARSMIHLLGPGSSTDSENVSRNTTNPLKGVIERASQGKIEPREVAMVGGIVDDLAGEIAAITSAIASLVETIISPVLRTVSELIYPVLHGVAKVLVEQVYPVAYVIFQVWYNSPLMLLTRELIRISLEVIKYILNNKLVQDLFHNIVFPAIRLVLDQVIFPPFEFLFDQVGYPLLKHVVWPVVAEVADVTWNVVIPTTQLAATLPLLVLDQALDTLQVAARQIGLPETLLHTFNYMVYLTIGNIIMSCKKLTGNLNPPQALLLPLWSLSLFSSHQYYLLSTMQASHLVSGSSGLASLRQSSSPGHYLRPLRTL